MSKLLNGCLHLVSGLIVAALMYGAMALPGFLDDIDAMVGPAPIVVVASR